MIEKLRLNAKKNDPECISREDVDRLKEISNIQYVAEQRKEQKLYDRRIFIRYQEECIF